MQVRETTPQSLIQGEKQFRVPIWQRQYTWTAKQHEQLWEDLLEQYRLLEEGAAAAVSGHFLGSFVMSPFEPSASGIQSFLVVDGQQRLTTLMLILSALRDVASETDPQAIDRYDKLHLINEFETGLTRYRLIPTEEDQPAFFARIDRTPDEGAQDAISRAYRFYRSRLQDESETGPLDLPRLTQVVLGRLAIVDITTQPGDNAHRIFQSLNGTGVPLEQADLLRNYLFMLLPSQAEHVYSQVWRPMEKLLGVEHLEGLARVDLQRRGIQVAREHIFAEHQGRLARFETDEARIEDEVRELARRARHYKRLVDPIAEQDDEARRALLRLGKWGAQTTHPVLMVAANLREDEILSIEEFRRILGYIESFLVRRQLARIPSHALNRVFIQLIEHLPEDEGFADALHRELSRDRLYWPDDDQIRKAVRSQPFFHIGRAHQRKMILERLEQSFDHPEPIDFDEAQLQVEHILPQTLSQEWREHLQSLGHDPDEVHQELVHTLANLTLTAFNGTLSNNPFARKQEIYGQSHLELNRALEESDAWGRDEILARADVLATQIIEIWPAPLAGITSAGSGEFDWSRVDAAIAALPSGRWTTYGDLAELSGTGAQAVGNYIPTLPTGTNAYRVLSTDGSVSPAFRWSDPTDDRDVRDVLAVDGISFESDRADPEARIGAEELATLIETPDDEASDDEATVLSPSGSNPGRYARNATEMFSPGAFRVVLLRKDGTMAPVGPRTRFASEAEAIAEANKRNADRKSRNRTWSVLEVPASLRRDS